VIAALEEARDLGFLGPGDVSFHVEHALAYRPHLPDGPGLALDLGAGGGVPGFVLAAADPGRQWVLLDGSTKRTAFLERAVRAVGLGNVIVRCARAEAVPDLRGACRAVVARGFGSPAVTAECGAPLLTVGGVLIVSEPPADTARDRWAGAGVLGLGAATVHPGPPSIAVLRQEQPCPAIYPRRTGVPGKRPLW
jgi:16S rRNA (guanine527-N7)-methyltransferase